MVLLFADSFKVGLAAVGGFRAIDIVEPQVKFAPGRIDFETVAVVESSINEGNALYADQFGGMHRHCHATEQEQGEARDVPQHLPQVFFHEDIFMRIFSWRHCL